jgi:hypothetical protein
MSIIFGGTEWISYCGTMGRAEENGLQCAEMWGDFPDCRGNCIISDGKENSYGTKLQIPRFLGRQKRDQLYQSPVISGGNGNILPFIPDGNPGVFPNNKSPSNELPSFQRPP